MHNGRRGIMALESISFQKGKLFADLTEAVGALRKVAEVGCKADKLFAFNEASALLKVIKQHTNITFVWKDGEKSGPAMMPPALTPNHLFIANWVKAYLQENTVDFDPSKDVRAILDKMSKPLVQGTVDLKNSRVTGLFAELEIELYMPPSIFTKAGLMSDGEIAAIILHEVGHAFTYMEFVTRSVTTNQVLAGLVRACDKSMPAEKREIIFVKGADVLKMSGEQKEALLKAKSQTEVGYIALDAAVQLSVSELGASCYDVNSCEYLADQFATRHGAGRELVTALDTLMKNNHWAKMPKGNWFIGAVKFILIVCAVLFITVATVGAIWLVIIFTVLTSPDKNGEIYDNEKTRFLRIKHQNVEWLKDQSLSTEKKKKLIEDNETIDKLSTYYDDNLSKIEKLSYFFSPTYRNAHKYEVLQKQLEATAHNDLFSLSAKLSTL